MTELYIGLMSGTSVDGIDAALVDFSDNRCQVVATHYSPYSADLRRQILSLCHQGDDEIKRLGELDVILGKEFARSVHALLQQRPVSGQTVQAIGSHGQTIRHHPQHTYPFTLQIGDPNIIAAETGITTIADFRRKDIAVAGQGAPLVPAFHHYVLASAASDRTVVNIGGIANVTLLPRQSDQAVIGFDTGPGNVLLDAWINKHQNVQHDQHGAWGRQGAILPGLLENMLSDAYFRLPPPKSTGREHFHLAWLEKHLQEYGKSFAPVDVQATLTELSARSIIDAVRNNISQGEILVCGGGSHNDFLMTRLRELARTDFQVDTTQKYGIDPDWVEAVAFAWLARQTLNRKPGNLPSVTGANRASVLGGIYYAI